MTTDSLVINRPGVARAILQTPLWLTVSLIPPNLQHIIIHKLLDLGSCNSEIMFTPHHMSHVMCHVSNVMCQVSRVTWHMSPFFSSLKKKSGGARRWRVCYQRGLPSLVLLLFKLNSLAAPFVWQIIVFLLASNNLQLLQNDILKKYINNKFVHPQGAKLIIREGVRDSDNNFSVLIFH